MSVDLVCLANSTFQDKLPNEGIHVQPPVITLHQVLGVKDSPVTACRALVQGLYKVSVGSFRDVALPTEVQVMAVKVPVPYVYFGKQQSIFIKGLHHLLD